MDRIVKGIWIPIEIWKDTTLSWNEKILLMEIDSFTSKDMDCFFSDEYIAQMLNVSDRQARNIISSLIQKGWIEKTRFDGRRRFLKSTLCLADRKSISYQGGDEFPHNNKEEQTSINKERDYKERTAFKKPSVEEVANYCRSRNNSIDAEEFVAFYESKGWMVGKNKMKDWKSAVITWEKTKTKSSCRPTKRESVTEHNLRVRDEIFGTDLHSQVYGRKEVDIDEQ